MAFGCNVDPFSYRDESIISKPYLKVNKWDVLLVISSAMTCVQGGVQFSRYRTIILQSRNATGTKK